jgi:hypothetical protein
MRGMFWMLALAIGCGPTGDTTDSPVVTTLLNQGAEREGHTPRGFEGQGTGLFVGDNLNSGFPEGDGVQVFLSFRLKGVAGGTVTSAELRAVDMTTNGTPFEDLGDLIAEEVVYDDFSSALWDTQVVNGGDACVLATSADDLVACDLTALVQAALDEGRSWAQVRLRHDLAGDSDGEQDLTVFNPADSNTNDKGLFELELTVVPDGS